MPVPRLHHRIGSEVQRLPILHRQRRRLRRKHQPIRHHVDCHLVGIIGRHRRAQPSHARRHPVRCEPDLEGVPVSHCRVQQRRHEVEPLRPAGRHVRDGRRHRGRAPHVHRVLSADLRVFAEGAVHAPVEPQLDEVPGHQPGRRAQIPDRQRHRVDAGAAVPSDSDTEDLHFVSRRRRRGARKSRRHRGLRQRAVLVAQDRHRIGSVVRHGDIRPVVPVQIPDRHPHGSFTGGEIDLGGERRLGNRPRHARIPQHRHRGAAAATPVTRDRQIGPAVPVHVAQRRVHRPAARGEVDFRRKRRCPRHARIAQHRHRGTAAAAEVRHDQVQLAVYVHVTQRQELGRRPRGEVDLGGE